MIAHRNLGLVAAAATVLAAAPLSAIFDRWTWLIQTVIVVATVAAAAALSRLGRTPLWAQILAMLGGLTLVLTWLFPSGDELLAVLPTPATFGHFAELLSNSVEDMRSYGVKVPDTDPLLFVTVLGIGGVAVLVDVLCVGLRRPALAGLPMLAIYSVPVAIYVDSVPPVPFAIGAAGFLWLLVADNVDRVRRFGRRFTGDGRDVDVWEASPLAAAGRRLAVVGLALAVLVPLAVPGMTAGLLTGLNSGQGSGFGGSGLGGSPGRVDLFAALSGQLNQSKVTDLVKVTTTEEEPFYLRFGVADELRSDGFRVRGPNGQRVTGDLPDPTQQSQQGVEQTRHRATVEVSRDLNMRLLPVYAEPIRFGQLGNNWFYDPNLQVVFSNREDSRDRRYEFDYVRSKYSVERLRTAQPLPADLPLRRQQTVTPDVPEVLTLVEGLIRGKRTEYDKVRAIYDYFSEDNGFSYRLSTEQGTSGQEILDFLENKVGYCQQYAAALAWMVRSAGIPARVAFGFTNGSRRSGGTFTLTNRNLHAWTEVYFDQIGWVPFDATPTYGVPGATRSAWAPDTDAPEETTPQPGTSGAPDDADPSAGPDRGPNQFEEDLDPGTGGNSNTPDAQTPIWLWWVAGLLVLLVLLAVPALRRLSLRRRRGRPAPAVRTVETPDADPTVAGTPVVLVGADSDRARADAHAAWDELIDTLVDYRIRVDRTETPRTTADRLAREALTTDTEAETAARLLGRAEERARYARDPLTGEPLPAALRTVRSALAGRADRRTRLVAAVLPPSVLQRWRTAVADGSSRLVASGGQLRYRLLRFSPRRVIANRTGR
ncbi:transglutaminase TgpA family protein [Micromonospora sp. CA-263727]|uniref:transglutaminase TgpA family protein n=1 Tax=Micromonospora sp. CA-263727 TaxID=3239967 RepID=UPI003D89DB8C